MFATMIGICGLVLGAAPVVASNVPPQVLISNSTFTGQAGTAISLPGVSIGDADAGTGQLVVTATAQPATAQLFVTGAAAVAGSGTPSVTLTGTLGDLNATLSTLSAIPTGTVNVVFTVDDQGNSGGPAQTASDSLIIDVLGQTSVVPDSTTTTTTTVPDDVDVAVDAPDQTFNLAPGLSEGPVDYSLPSVAVDGAALDVEFQCTPAPGATLPAGTHEIECVGVFDGEPRGSVSFDLTVIATGVPTATTTAPPAVTPQPAPQTPPPPVTGALPEAGTASATLAVVGALLLTAGIGLLRFERRYPAGLDSDAEIAS